MSRKGPSNAVPKAVIMADDTGTVVLANAEAARLFGYRREALFGLPIETLMSDSSRTSSIALREAFINPSAALHGSRPRLIER